MNNILDYMDLLNEIDTEDVEELVNVHDMTSPLRVIVTSGLIFGQLKDGSEHPSGVRASKFPG